MKLEQRPRRLSRGERARIIALLRRRLSGDPRVVFAYLYGSILEERPVRDVDVAVWLRPGVDPLEYVLGEGLRLEMILGLPVDLAVLNHATPVLRYHVYRRGMLITCKDHSLHELERIKATLMYLDLQLLKRMVKNIGPRVGRGDTGT